MIWAINIAYKSTIRLYVLRGFLLRLQCCQRKSVNLFVQTRLLAILNMPNFRKKVGKN